MKILEHNGFKLELEKVVVGYKVQIDYFTRKGTPNAPIAQRYGNEYKIANCNCEYNTSKLLIDWKYILDNIEQYEWVKPYLK